MAALDAGVRRRDPLAGSPAVRLDELAAVIFDMDGVVTDTASVHAAAWKRLFDAFLEERARETGEAFVPFGDADYRRYVDGKPRYDGVRDFLAARGITLPEGEAGDPPHRVTVRALGNRKDTYFLAHVREDGVKAYPGTVDLVAALRRAGLRVAVISASRNLAQVLDAAGVSALFDARVDGVESERLGLRGKPDPAIFLEAAARLRVEPDRAAVVEDALAGVEAGRRGGFGLVVGVDRTGHPDELRARGADVVVGDPGELLAMARPLPAWPAGLVAEPTRDPAWLVEVVDFDPLRERDVESWFAVSNGRTGTRGSLEEGSPEAAPATYAAGIFGDSATGRRLVPGPEWTRLEPRIGDEAVRLDSGAIVEHRRILDLRQGILFRTWRQRLSSGTEFGFRSARFASLADRDVLALTADGTVGGRPARLNGGIPSSADQDAVAGIDKRAVDDGCVVEVRGLAGGASAYAVATEERDGRLTRIVAMTRALADSPAATGRAGLGAEAERRLHQAHATGIAALIDRHRQAWDARWRDADVVIDGDPAAQRALRFALYHLIAAGDPESDAASVGARGLTGPGYKGHVFWDTDVFVLPFLIHTHPATARALLAYRHRTLPAARERARSLGYRGALFAWESADTGVDVTPTEVVGPDGRRIPILTGLQEHHVAADVAWAAWRYWEATGDDEFMARMGAEIVLETARFWASRADPGRDGRYHIARVIGPDEYHVGVRDNAFTNVMARWNLERAVEVAALLREQDPTLWRGLAGRIGLRPGEPRRWTAVARGLVDGFDPETGLYEQFAGFFGLEDVPVADLAPRPFAADVLLGERRVRRAQVVKQADVLMFVHMLPELVPLPVVDANYRYYEPRTSHGSSLCPAIHAAVAARLGRLDEALAYFRMAGAVDLGNGMGNASQGVHVASMGALWQAAASGFAGARADGRALRIDPPGLPPGWRSLEIPIRWRGIRVEIAVAGESVAVTLDGPADLAVGGNAVQRLGARRYAASRTDGRWRQFEEVR